MKKITFSILFTLLLIASSYAQDFTTPNTGLVYTLDDIATASPTTITVSGTDYTMFGNLTIAENDTLLVDSDLTLSIDADLRITIFGTFTVNADAVTFTAIDEDAPYEGFRFEENSVVNIQNSTITYGGGLRVLNEDFTLNNCTLSHNVSGISTGSVVSLSRGTPQITNNIFTFNQTPAVSSAANRQVSAYIFNNYIEANNIANSNRPQINMGTTRATDTLRIIQNTIIGDPANTRAGGIAVSNLTGGQVLAIIDDNIIQGNRYGITVVGANAFAYIRNNIIEDNDIEGDPLIGGSGISINTNNGPHTIVASGNEIRRNLWGITVIGEAMLNLGDDEENPGGNIFSENGNGGEIFALYNNTPHTIMAKHNCWIEDQESTPEDVEDVIFHSVDDPNLGEVIFEPFLCGIVVGIEENTFADFSFYPNPVKDEIHFNNNYSIEKVEIYGIQGNLISSKKINDGLQALTINLPGGLYFVKFSNDFQTVTKKMIVE
ncbi:T9SS type A sorting domain-containing protein [Aequorivita sp. H23M31]|uniref:T9SS type A sorting domain-containing protein n=1 Tax=Aequorivita ciconiae TaxID=2494375 RepID=A0A410G3J5_9FLAO|nr:T9SS type A sorting domain-containing protein [Aequorivita sp. H23M31]QAA81785.1 T9SS type A sorting domain-containing protein [Aequorivita sp. H23M31]